MPYNRTKVRPLIAMGWRVATAPGVCVKVIAVVAPSTVQQIHVDVLCERLIRTWRRCSKVHSEQLQRVIDQITAQSVSYQRLKQVSEGCCQRNIKQNASFTGADASATALHGDTNIRNFRNCLQRDSHGVFR